MLTTDSDILEIAHRLRQQQAQTGLEHLHAVAANGTVWNAQGKPNHVIAPHSLQALYSQAGAGIVYHHSHPDDRALSPSDLHLIENAGVTTIWAHAPSGASYGARLRDGRDKVRYREALNALHAFLDPEIVRYHGVLVDDLTYESLRDFAVMLTLDGMGWIDIYLAWSDETRRLIASTGSVLAVFQGFLGSVTPAP